MSVRSASPTHSLCLLLLQMDSYLGVVQDYDIGSDFMHYIERHPKLKDEPEDYQFEEFSPDE